MTDSSGVSKAPSRDELPRSLGHVLRVLRVSPPEGSIVEIQSADAHMSQADLARVLAKIPGRSKLGRQRPAAVISDGMIGSLERSEQFDVWKIARYANWTGLPVSVIMLVQELAAHLRDNKVDLAKQIAEATIAVCNTVVESAERLAGSDPGPGADLSPEQRELMNKCHNKDKQHEPSERLEQNYKFFLIANELFRSYPKDAMKTKRAEWQKK